MKREKRISMKRVLMISSRADYGGGPTHILGLLQYLPSTMEVFVACPCEEPYWREFANVVGPQRMLAIPHRQFTAKALLDLYRFVKRHDINVIHSHGKGAGLYGRLLAKLTGRRCIHTYHGIHLSEYKNVKRILYLALERWLSRYACHLVAVSESEASWTRELGLCPASKVVVIPNGVPVAGSSIPAGGGNKQPLLVLTSSWFNKQKNSELLAPIMQGLFEMKRLQDFLFVIIGDGENRPQLEKSLRQRFPSLALECPGVVSDPSGYMKRAFCYLSTSLYEGLPYAMIEAMVHSVPVVASDVVGNRDLVTEGVNGFLYPLESPEQAALALVKLSEDPMLACRMGEQGRLRVEEHFSVVKMAADTADLYCSVGLE